jgi:hypothetical protein
MSSIILSFITHIVLFSLSRLSVEEPFTILPQQAFCDKIYTWCMEMVTWRPGDNGMSINSYAKSCDSIGDGINVSTAAAAATAAATDDEYGIA